MTAIMAEPQARPTAEAKRALFETLAARFGDRFSLSQALREQHANTLTWLKCQPPDAVLFAKTQGEISEIVRLCAKARMPVIPFGTGTSLEGHVNAPFGGISLDLSRMDRILAVHEADLDCAVEPGVTRKTLNDHLRGSGLFFPVDPGADARGLARHRHAPRGRRRPRPVTAHGQADGHRGREARLPADVTAVLGPVLHADAVDVVARALHERREHAESVETRRGRRDRLPLGRRDLALKGELAAHEDR